MKDKIVYIIAGPNGSGKTTFAKELMNELDFPFVNADEIAMELAGLQLEKARIRAGKIFLKTIKDYIISNKSFIVETTLAGRYFVRIIERLKKTGYRTELIYIFVETVEEAIDRIDIRVKKGGHFVPNEDIRRRFTRSKTNFWNTYRFLVDNWKVFFNGKDEFLQIAVGSGSKIEIIDEISFSILKEGVI